jgi:hypothetical protein
MNNPKLLSPAFPPIPSQNDFGNIMALIPGMSLLDYAAIQIYSHNAEKLTMAESVKFAEELINELYKAQSELALATQRPNLSV